MGVFAAALRWDVGDASLHYLQQFLLHSLTGDVTGDGPVEALFAGDFIKLVDVDDAVLRGVFRGAQQRGEIRRDLDAQEIAEHYVSLLNSTVARWLRGYWEEPDSLEDRVMRALDLLVRGLRPREGEDT